MSSCYVGLHYEGKLRLGMANDFQQGKVAILSLKSYCWKKQINKVVEVAKLRTVGSGLGTGAEFGKARRPVSWS